MAKDILKEAIADAKAVREVALANAKAALEEAFTPKLQSMLSAKLSEELDEEINEEEETNESVEETTIEEDSFDEMYGYEEDKEDPDDEGYMGKSMEEEIDLEEILAELELEEGEEVSEEPVAEGEEEEIAEGEKDELEENGPVYKAEEANRVGYQADYVNEDFDLDALLEELDGLDEAKDDDEVNEAKDDDKDDKKMEESKDEELEEAKKDDDKDKEMEESVNPLQAELDESKDELEETKKAFKAVRTELNEVNLLNSKLLYVNRIFKANQLDESQKLRVVESLDKAGTTKEAKLIYETIKDTFNISKGEKRKAKSSIKEGLGMASKPAGKSTAAKKEVISESNDMMKRFQKLANIKINQ